MKTNEQYTLLLVEPEPIIRKYIASCIRQLKHFHILETSTPGKAMKIIEKKVPDVILYNTALEEIITESLIVQARSLDSEYYPFIIAVSPLKNENQIQAAYDLGANYFLDMGFSRHTLMGILYNIISQIEYRNALTNQERLFRNLFELAISPMLLVKTNDMMVVKANHAAAKLYAVDRGNLPGTNIDTFSCEGEQMSSALKRRVTLLSNVVQKKSDGKTFHARVAFAYFEEAHTEMALITVNDITEELRKLEETSALQLFEKISHQKATTKEALAFLTGEQNERRRISGELHDHIGHSMVSLKLQIENIIHKVNEKTLQDSLYDIRNNLIDVADSIHGLSEDMSDYYIPGNDLTSAVKKLVSKIAKTRDVNIKFTFGEKPPTLSLFVQTNLYRIIEEALSNIVKHTPTCDASLDLKQDKDHLHLCIANHWAQPKNGINLKGMGLRLMQQRAALIGGKLRYNKTTTSFQVTLHLPVAKLTN